MCEAVKNMKNNIYVLKVHSMDLCESIVLSEERVLPVVAPSLLVGQKRVTFMNRGRNISY